MVSQAVHLICVSVKRSVWERLSLVHLKGRGRNLGYRTPLDMKLFRSVIDLTPFPGFISRFKGTNHTM